MSDFCYLSEYTWTYVGKCQWRLTKNSGVFIDMFINHNHSTQKAPLIESHYMRVNTFRIFTYLFFDLYFNIILRFESVSRKFFDLDILSGPILFPLPSFMGPTYCPSLYSYECFW
jgi:hypothetical protein